MFDYIIVGSGLAGGILALRLQKAGKKIAVIDNADPNAAFHVAGGIWNAMTFKRIIKGWQADLLTDEAHQFYDVLQKEWSLNFYHPREIVRVFSDVSFQNNWLSKSNEPEYKSYLSDKCPEKMNELPVKLPFGCGTVKRAGYVNLDIFMPALHQYLKANTTYITEDFEYDKLTLNNNDVKYKNIEAGAVVFCEGYGMVRNPFFNWLPMRATKGEVLTLKNPGWDFNFIFNNGKHLIDNKDGTLGVGATFDWDNLDFNTTSAARYALLNHLEKNFNFKDWQVIDQKAGIRPTVSDRRPLAGRHPKLDKLFIFNGLGTKGVLIAPWLSKMMSNYLCIGSQIHYESDISRFIKKHFANNI
jgi:glycine/D-amino acid oxidase-like deaminating enzyme